MVTTSLLFDLINPAPADPRRHVPDTSKAAHREAVASGRLGERNERVLDWLQRHNRTAEGHAATSAELAYLSGPDTLAHVLYVRRGLSDLLKLGLVGKGADRKCSVTRRTCHTWKVVSR